MATANLPLGSLLFGTYRRQALGLLLLNPESEFHVRDLSRATGTSAGTMHKELSRLAAAGILRRRSRGNQALYGADTTCPIFEELRSILRKTSGLADSIRDALALLELKISAAFIYGSFARGEEGPGSDVDLMVVGDASFADVVDAIHPVQGAIGREINPVAYSLKEFRGKAHEAGSFVQRILREKKLFLKGDESALGKLVENKAAPRAHSQRARDEKAVQSRAATTRRRKK
jgi:predicted nucleotidyltransferase